MEPGIDIPSLTFGGGTAGGRSPEQHRRYVAVERARQTAIYVCPLGNLHELHVPPPVNGRPINRGDTIVVWANDEIQIAKKYREDGYTMFSEWCDEEPEKLSGYREMMIARANGVPIRVLKKSDLLPSKLLEKQAAAGIGAADGKAFVPGMGIVDDPEIKDALDDKLKSLGLKPPSRSRSDA